MSHFVMLVIGDDVEGQLAPFDENTVMDRYVRYTRDQLIESCRADIKRYLKGYYTNYMRDPAAYIAGVMERGGDSNPDNNKHLEYIRFEFPLKWKWTNEQCHTEEIKYNEPEDITPDGGVYSTYNPLSQWDWFQIGGRWPGKLLLLPGLKREAMPNFAWGYDVDESGREIKKNILSEPRVDSALVGWCDWDKMHQNPKEFAQHLSFWDAIHDGVEPIDDEVRKWVENDYYRKGYYKDRYGDAETFARCNANFTCWGYLKNGVWREKGKMGWWGCSDESDRDAVKWDLGFYDNVIKPLAPGTRITVVDCHI